MFLIDYQQKARFMKIFYDEGSLDGYKTTLDGADMLFSILDQNPQYLIVNFKGLKHNDEGFYDLYWKNKFDYNYLMIRDHREDLNRAFFEYLYHPSRIQKWIEAGNDIEDYMM